MLKKELKDPITDTLDKYIIFPTLVKLTHLKRDSPDYDKYKMTLDFLLYNQADKAITSLKIYRYISDCSSWFTMSEEEKSHIYFLNQDVENFWYHEYLFLSLIHI